MRPTLLCAATIALLGVAATHAQTQPLPSSGKQVRPLLVGASLPAAQLTADDGTPFDLTAALADKPAVVVFYRGGW